LEIAAERIRCSDRIEVAVESQDMENRGVGADGHTHPSMLDGPERGDGHAGPLRDQLRRQAATEPGDAKTLAKLGKSAFYRREQLCHAFCHAIILPYSKL
jgi:hypothetical protein